MTVHISRTKSNKKRQTDCQAELGRIDCTNVLVSEAYILIIDLEEVKFVDIINSLIIDMKGKIRYIFKIHVTFYKTNFIIVKFEIY